MRLFAKTFTQSARRERKQSADGFDTELQKRVTELGLDVQSTQRHFARDALLLGEIAKDRDAFFRFSDGIAAEAREADRQIYYESLRAIAFLLSAGETSPARSPLARENAAA